MCSNLCSYLLLNNKNYQICKFNCDFTSKFKDKVINIL